MSVENASVLALSILSVFLATAHTSAAGPVAVVVDFGPTGIEGVRGGSPAKFELGTVLRDGDRFTVPSGGFVKIDRGGVCQLLIAPGNTVPDTDHCTKDIISEYTVAATDVVGEVSGRFERLAEVLDWWDPKKPRKPMRSRDSYRSRVPVLEGIEKPFVVDGLRTLQIRWVDGKPPFKLTALMQDGTSFDGNVEDKERRGTIELPVKEGSVIRIELTAASQVTAYSIYGTSPSAFQLGGEDFGDYDRASRILALISESSGNWAFEGSQEIAGLRLEPRVKQALTDAIQFGDWP